MSAGSRKTTYQKGDDWRGNPGGIPKSARRLRKMSRYAAGLAIQEMATRLEQDPESIDGAALPKYAKVLADYGGYMSDKDQAQLMIQAAAARAHFKKADGSYDEDAFHRFVLVTMGHAPKQLMAVDTVTTVDTPSVEGPGPALEPDSGANEVPTEAGVGQFLLEDE